MEKKGKSVLLISDNAIASGCRYLMSALKEKAIDCSMVIYKFDHESNLEHLVRLCRELDVSIIGVSIFSSRRIGFKNLLHSLKDELPHVKTVGGGPDVNSDYNYCIDWLDFVCLNDGELAFPNLCKALLDGRDVTAENLPNIYFKRGNELFKNSLLTEHDIDRYGFPYFSDADIYDIGLGSTKPHKDSSDKSYNVYASRGCPYKCSYCSNHLFSGNYPGKIYYRVRSVKNIIEEIRLARQNNPNIETIIFHDEQFGLNRIWFDEFISEYKKQVNLKYFVQMNPKDLSMDKARIMKQSGLQMMSFGMQSGSPRIRELYRRPETLDDVKNANEILHELRIPHFFDLIVDNPVEDIDDLGTTLLFLLNLKKPFVAKTFDLIHLPKTKLTDYLLENKLIDEKKIEGNYIYDKEINWRVKVTDTTMSFDQQYVVALIHLAGNALIPNSAIRYIYARRNNMPFSFKKKLIGLTLSNAYYHRISMLNYIMGLITEGRIVFLVKKVLSKIGKILGEKYAK